MWVVLGSALVVYTLYCNIHELVSKKKRIYIYINSLGGSNDMFGVV